MSPEVTVAAARLRSAWDAEIRSSARRALVALVLAVFFVAAHVARIGSPVARAVAGGALAVAILGVAVSSVVARRRRRDVRKIIRMTVGKTDPALGASTLRAITLAERADADPDVGSRELADLHLHRLLGRASLDRVSARAARAARSWSSAGLALAALALVASAVEPFRVVEGLDVLAARDGRAPVPLSWLDDVDITAKPPEYLHQSEQMLLPFSPASLPRGTTLVVRGVPLHRGRILVLTDGKTEVPFVDDGARGLVAHFTLGDSAHLVVAARFGAVLVPQLDDQPVTSIPDEAPKVTVEGAPRTARLLDEPEVSIRWEATDDHGLREVDLVLRAGGREERRILGTPQAEAKVDRGGHELRQNDPFLRHAWGPVEVTVEARDNDPISGPKWGKSAPIILVPPQVGEPEALRIAGLVKARDALTDLLADRLLQKAPTAKDRKDHVAHEKDAQTKAVAAVSEALGATYGGLVVKRRMQHLALGQLRRLEKALDAEAKAPSSATHEKLLSETEQVLLAFDAGVRLLGHVDARSVAKRLAGVADEVATAIDTTASPEPPKGTAEKLEAGITVLDGGGKQMLRLGELGTDLGEIVANDLRRVARAREAKDLPHAAMAARDLAARLRHPERSFGAGGGSGAGGESGGRKGVGDDDASEATEEQEQAMQDLEDLAREHAGVMNEVAKALDDAAQSEDLQELRNEAKEHAQAIRDAVKNLPGTAGDPGSAESAAAEGRERAEAMASALERGQPGDAVESGKGAMRALDDAKRLGEQNQGFFPEERAGRESAEARGTIEHELAWAEQALRELRKRASAHAKDALDRAGEAEGKLADKTRELARRGESGDAAMPEEMLDHLSDAERAMRDAQRTLQGGEGEHGHEQQEQAQRDLEQASRQQDEQDEPQPSSDRLSADGPTAHPKDQPIPGKEDHKGPDDFRRRVLEGLGQTSDPLLREAVKRYAEGLLR